MTPNTKQITRQMLTPFFSGNGLDSVNVCTNVQALKVVEQVVKRALN